MFQKQWHNIVITLDCKLYARHCFHRANSIIKRSATDVSIPSSHWVVLFRANNICAFKAFKVPLTHRQTLIEHSHRYIDSTQLPLHIDAAPLNYAQFWRLREMPPLKIVIQFENSCSCNYPQRQWMFDITDVGKLINELFFIEFSHSSALQIALTLCRQQTLQWLGPVTRQGHWMTFKEWTVNDVEYHNSSNKNLRNFLFGFGQHPEHLRTFAPCSERHQLGDLAIARYRRALRDLAGPVGDSQHFRSLFHQYLSWWIFATLLLEKQSGLRYFIGRSEQITFKRHTCSSTNHRLACNSFDTFVERWQTRQCILSCSMSRTR